MSEKETQEREFFGIDTTDELFVLKELSMNCFDEDGKMFPDTGSEEHRMFLNENLLNAGINISFGFKPEVVGIFCILKQEIQEPEDINEETLNRVNRRIKDHHNRIQVKRIFLSNKE